MPTVKPSLTEQDFIAAANSIGCEVAAVKAVAEVEAPRGGFNPDDTPATLFEGHWFHRFTEGLYDTQHPTISYPKWTRQFYGKTWQVEQARLYEATQLNMHAAYLSASWGRFQIMGFNAGICGFVTVEQFVNTMRKSEGEHLKAFIAYIKHECLDDELRGYRWDGFARRYNGPLYQKNDYAGKLQRAYERWLKP